MYAAASAEPGQRRGWVFLSSLLRLWRCCAGRALLECVTPNIQTAIEEEDAMKGQDAIIGKLNELLADELTAINQYMVQSEMCANWGYQKLHKAIEKEAIDEMKHAEKLIARILFLEGSPTVSRLNTINIGGDIPTMLKNNWTAESGAIKSYNEGIRQSAEALDHGTRELLDGILKDEEGHIDWIEAQQDQIKQMGLQNYLTEQMD